MSLPPTLLKYNTPGADPRGWFGGFKPRPPRKKIIILFRGFHMNWLHTERQTVPNEYASDCMREPLKIKKFPGAGFSDPALQ